MTDTNTHHTTKRPVSPSPEAQARIDRFVDRVDERLETADSTAGAVREALARMHGDSDVYDR